MDVLLMCPHTETALALWGSEWQRCKRKKMRRDEQQQTPTTSTTIFRKPLQQRLLLAGAFAL
jgi:hypothetical protein